MPDVDVDNTVVVGCASGHFHTTKSWVLGRLLRDFKDAVNKEMKDEQPHIPPGMTLEPKKEPSARERVQEQAWEALRITVFEVENEPSSGHGIPTLDWVWLSGCAVILIQLGIAIVAWTVDGSWDIFLITAAGNTLALVEDLFGIGLLGNTQNIIAAGAVRTPSVFGIHIKNVDTIQAARVVGVLKQIEMRYPLVDTLLVDVFFPGSLRVKETSDIDFWRAALDARMRPNNYGTRLGCLLHHSMDNDKSL
ncbi:hypothetical protein BBP40_009394 [Aspergillus hancockii]|nr:hypothetical protein BBP40_009394 [Aspergillus hancockii]